VGNTGLMNGHGLSESDEHESETEDGKLTVQHNSASAQSHGCAQRGKPKTQTGKNKIKTRLTRPASLEMAHYWRRTGLRLPSGETSTYSYRFLRWARRKGEPRCSRRSSQCCRRRVSEDSRPQRHCLELLDGSVSASWFGACQCPGFENLPGRRCRCRPRPGTRRLQRFPHAVERRRPRRPHPGASQGRVCEATVNEPPPR
jgi:hypothetical protein